MTSGCFTRRSALKGLALLSGSAAFSGLPAFADTLPEAHLLLGGTLASPAGQFGELAAGALSRSLGLETPIQLVPDLGQDGVRAANLFDANGAPDGSTAIAAQGATLLASLIGDNRVHYDFGRWIPVLIAHTTTIVVARAELHRTLRSRLTGFFHDHPVRLAVSRPAGNELNALLGLSLLGLRPVPVPGYLTATEALAALREGKVDAVQISPYALDVPLDDALAHLPSGTAALYHTGDLTDTQTDSIPNFLEAYQEVRGRPPEGPLFNAWRAIAASLDTALVIALPMLTPPDIVAQWSKACIAAATDNGVRHWAAKHHFMLASGDNAAPFLSRSVPDLGATLALRRWVTVNTTRWRAGQETRRL
ncbi:hypothetical protein [Gluconobacter morbifer]|uniref:Leucine-binding protein domain-containing protein n=1 Tax=Gluconobacter morbifer G707 TaxID=1088869 RepID=G6XGI5_9PROT|nr:hypothetical protein [Gluconobacter morbifer]EHH69293.1 hypothetical protein GMO_06000 [Gluconobacter morbifer G707]